VAAVASLESGRVPEERHDEVACLQSLSGAMAANAAPEMLKH
jgi:hypothetical protein